MEFHEKLQYLRKQHHLTQDQLAEKLYVSRTAVSKWESGKGYPNIESLKHISKEFEISIDELLSGNDLLELAETENRKNINRLNRLIYAMIDGSSVIFMFIPLFGEKEEEYVRAVTLFVSQDIPVYLRMLYGTVLVIMTLFGIVEFFIQDKESDKWLSACRNSSLILHAVALVIFMISRQPYVSVFLFVFFVIKCVLIIRKKTIKQYD